MKAPQTPEAVVSHRTDDHQAYLRLLLELLEALTQQHMVGSPDQIVVAPGLHRKAPRKSGFSEGLERQLSS